MDSIFEKAQLRFSLLLTRVINKLASIAAHICITMAFSLSPRKYFRGKFCLSCLKSNSICHRFLYCYEKEKSYTSGFKTVVLEAFQERETIQEIGKKYEIHPNQISTWKSQFLPNILKA